MASLPSAISFCKAQVSAIRRERSRSRLVGSKCQTLPTEIYAVILTFLLHRVGVVLCPFRKGFSWVQL